MPQEEQPMNTNISLYGLVPYLHSYILEMCKCNSTRTTDWKSNDLARCKKFMRDFTILKDFYISLPEQDFVHTGSDDLPLPDVPDVPAMTSKGCHILCKMMQALYIEILWSTSTRQDSGIAGPDQIRITNMVKNIEKFIKQFVEATDPMDLPRSTPLLTGKNGE